MARLITAGAESGHVSTEGVTQDLGTITVVSSVKRSGNFAFASDSGVGNASNLGFFAFSGSLGTTYFARGYVQFTATPAGTISLLKITDSASSDIYVVQLTSGGKFRLAAAGSVQIGSDSTLTAAINTWYRIELKVKVGAGSSDDDCELKITTEAGVTETVATETGGTRATATPARFNFGSTAPGASKIFYYDDMALNDSSGANQNSYPGSGKVAILLPISDNARASLWTGGVGGTTSLFEAVNNTPPIGTATETDLTQIEHAGGAAGTTDAYDANMTTYSTAGIGSSDTINLVQTIYNHGEDVATGTKLLNVSIVSNPAVASIGNVPAGRDVGALGTFPTNWATDLGTVTYVPSVTVGTSPVMRATRPETATRVASIDFMGIIVDYTPAAFGALPPRRPRLSRFTQLRS